MFIPRFPKGKCSLFPTMAQLLVDENQELKQENAHLKAQLELKTKEFKVMKAQVMGTLGLLSEYTDEGEGEGSK